MPSKFCISCSFLERYFSNPKQFMSDLALRNVKYLNRTKRKGLIYKHKTFFFEVHNDTGWASTAARRSTSDFLAKINRNIVALNRTKNHSLQGVLLKPSLGRF